MSSERKKDSKSPDMKYNRKRTKVSRATKQDRLSSLPDCVLCHILSFLPTKYAAMTSILSKRWKYLFLGVQTIDLDESLLLKRQKNQGSRTDENRNFINFVNMRLMLRQTASITEFRLKCKNLPRAPEINLWLTTLLFREVKVLEIEVENFCATPLRPPSGLFRSETLVVLKFLRGPVFKITEFVCFPNLKVLNLKDSTMQFESKDLRLAEGYPLLEELRLDGIRFQKIEENKGTLAVSIRTLKVLAITGMQYEFSSIEIDTPHLQHLKCTFEGWSDTRHMQINLCECESLVSAYFYIPRVPTLLAQGGQWFKLLSKVNNVKDLHLLGGHPLDLSIFPNSLHQFPNLTNLELTGSGRSLRSLLQRAPNLKSLVCDMVINGNNPLPPENEPLCHAENLREIRMKNFKETPEELEVVRSVLQNGAVLERVILERPRNRKEEWASSTWKLLVKLRRRSPKCEVDLI